MSLHNVTPGPKAPEEFNVIIEIPMNADPIKYEVDEDSGALFVDRFMATSMHYPCNYGYVPHDPGRRRRPGGCAGGDASAADSRRGGDLPCAGHAEACRTRPAATTSWWRCPSSKILPLYSASWTS
jgi:hypothetical protein